MPARKFESRLLVLSKSEGRRTVSLQVVTLVALVFVGLAGELVVVLVHMAIGATLEVRDLENRVLALGRVTLVALQLGMSIDERIITLGMRLHVEQRGLPALDVVAVGALDAPGPLRELPVVLVLVAIGAFRKRELFLKVSFHMAGLAFHRSVLALQRIFGLGVIEGIVKTTGGDSFPPTRGMAGLAVLVLETPFVGVSVAIVALTEGQALITRCTAGIRSVALFALHLLVQAG